MGALDQTYKPDSVPLRIVSGAGVIISLELELPRASCDLPEDLGRANRFRHRQPGPVIAVVLLFGLAPGDACRAVCVTTNAVGSYPTVSPLPDPLRAIGGLFSVAPVSDRSAWVLPSTLPSESGLSSRRTSRRASTRSGPVRGFSIIAEALEFKQIDPTRPVW